MCIRVRTYVCTTYKATAKNGPSPLICPTSFSSDASMESPPPSNHLTCCVQVVQSDYDADGRLAARALFLDHDEQNAWLSCEQISPRPLSRSRSRSRAPGGAPPRPRRRPAQSKTPSDPQPCSPKSPINHGPVPRLHSPAPRAITVRPSPSRATRNPHPHPPGLNMACMQARLCGC